MDILERLNRCYPFAENEIQQGVHELLGPINQRIVHQAVEALQAGDAERLGALMTEAQAAFDRYALPACPEQLTAPVLHRVLSYEPLHAAHLGRQGHRLAGRRLRPVRRPQRRPTSRPWSRSSSATWACRA